MQATQCRLSQGGWAQLDGHVSEHRLIGDREPWRVCFPTRSPSYKDVHWEMPPNKKNSVGRSWVASTAVLFQPRPFSLEMLSLSPSNWRRKAWKTTPTKTKGSKVREYWKFEWEDWKREEKKINTPSVGEDVCKLRWVTPRFPREQKDA